MRGARRDVLGFNCSYGIIPADAGSTALVGAVAVAAADHPRGCGEHPEQGGQEQGTDGSSPRMRGAHTLVACYFDWSGIIPADAGSTLLFSLMTSHRTDHPRGCGEH